MDMYQPISRPPRRHHAWLLLAASAFLSLEGSRLNANEAIRIDRLRDGGVPTVIRERHPAPKIRIPGGGGDPLLENGDFSLGLASWTATQSGGSASPGAATADAGAALLSEGDSFLVTLEQSFSVPERATELSLRLALEPGFDHSGAFIPDAFELSLLDGANVPVVSTWDSLATSSFNLSETGAVHASQQATWDGTTVRIDLRSVAAGTRVTLFLDLIGADEDTAGAVRVDNVDVRTGPPPGSFVRGNSNADLNVDISDGIFSLTYLFIGGEEPGCLDAVDANDDGLADITDPIYTFTFLFLGGPDIAAPFPQCGVDPTSGDPLTCAQGFCPE